MNIIGNLLGKIITILDFKTQRVVGLIENDYGLIRYILKILREYEISSTNGYLQFENKKGEIYLHRIVLEYYSQFNTKLFTILSNPSQYEVNHKNKKKWDNRLENLELVTKLGNERHKRGRDYQSEIVMTSEEIIQIKDKLQQDKQYHSDKKYLEKVSHRNWEYLKKGDYYWDCNKQFYDNLYIRLNNPKLLPFNISSTTISINTLESFSNYIFKYIKNTFLSTNNIIDLNYNYDKYRAKNILSNNLKLLYKYYNSNEYFRSICNNYNLINHTTEELNYNIILDIFYYMLPRPLIINFYKNQFYISASVKDLILTYKKDKKYKKYRKCNKYNSFRVLYLLQLLQRKRVYYNEIRHTVSAFIIPKYTDLFFTTTVLPLSHSLYQQNLSTITHTIITKNHDLLTADKVYQSSYRTRKTKESLISITDIENLLSHTLLPKIKLYGFITLNELRKELQLLNNQRKINLQPFIEVKDTDIRFISRMIRNITEIKQLMNQLKIGYKTINTNTKEKINQYQLKNGIEEPTTLGLTYQQRIIVLNKLYVESKKKSAK